jgi:hypothetical protein
MAWIPSASGDSEQSSPSQPAVSICYLSDWEREDLPENVRKGEEETFLVNKT